MIGTRDHVFADAPRNVYWETTVACDLACVHCRANAIPDRDPQELTTAEAQALMGDVQAMGSMLILTGGDPMKRPDLFELIGFGRSLGLPISITPSTTPTLTREVVHRFRSHGVAAMGLSLDGPDPERHDGFRGVAGTFDHALAALGWAREAGLPVQVNTTVTADTIDDLPRLYRLLCDRAAPPVRRWSLFLLIPVGRGSALRMPEPAQVERLFEWVYRTSQDAPFQISTVEAPHYRRYWIRRKLEAGVPPADIARLGKRMGFGVRDGNGVIFVSHVGEVYPAGFLPAPRLGSVRDRPLSEIYRNTPDLVRLRDMDQLRGPCGACGFRWECGGSRARAFATSGDWMGSDPACSYT